MTTATFINAAREAGFKEEQVMFLLDTFEHREGEVVTKDHLEAKLSEVKSFITNMELRIYSVCGIAAWYLLSKINTIEQTLAVISSKL